MEPQSAEGGGCPGHRVADASRNPETRLASLCAEPASGRADHTVRVVGVLGDQHLPAQVPTAWVSKPPWRPSAPFFLRDCPLASLLERKRHRGGLAPYRVGRVSRFLPT